MKLACIGGFLLAGILSAQTNATSFEVASIRPHRGAVTFSADPAVRGSRMIGTASTLADLITVAYGVRYDQISSGPGWITSDRFDIEAKAPGDVPPTTEQARLMMQNLLAERFRLRLHRETRDLPAYALVVGKNGAKLKLSDPDAREAGVVTTLPVADLNAQAATGTVVFPHLAAGGGWMTQTILINPMDNILTGTIQNLDSSGQAVTSSFPYSIPARTSLVSGLSNAGPRVVTGSVRVVPAANTVAPSGVTLFSFRNDGVTVTEASVPAIAPGTSFRLYAEASASIQTGIAVANTSANAVSVALELTRLDGSSTGLAGTLPIPGNGQTSVFLNQIQGFGSLPASFQGVLRLSSPSPIAVTGLRGRYNERNDFLITTTPPVNETAASSAPLFFPHIADSGGYTTQFILFSAQPGSPSSGTMQLFNQSGGVLGVAVQ